MSYDWINILLTHEGSRHNNCAAELNRHTELMIFAEKIVSKIVSKFSENE